tara:strand:- start:305 stop:703 length:399 start_codon:yes stop_codon:yes gene_type:complete
MKIGVIGNSRYENKRRIKKVIFDLKNRFGDKLIVATLGNRNGAEKYVKKYVLEMGMQYKEFNPAHTQKTLYSAMNESYYNKPYRPRNFFHRNTMLVKYIDYIIAFIDNAPETGIDDILKNAKKFEKKVMVIE